MELHSLSPLLARAFVDADRCRQVLLNLLVNAIKFTPEGGTVLVLVDVVGGGGEQLCRVRVSDTGIGLSEQGIQRLFQPFSQAEEDTRERFGGTGLGLAISRRCGGACPGGEDGAPRSVSVRLRAEVRAVRPPQDHAGDGGRPDRLVQRARAGLGVHRDVPPGAAAARFYRGGGGADGRHRRGRRRSTCRHRIGSRHSRRWVIVIQ